MRRTEKGRLVLASELSEMARAEHELMRLIERYHYSEHDRFAIKLAIEEALANAIKHGNAGATDKSVIIEYEITPEYATFSVQDEGEGFDPDQVDDPTLEENLSKPSGRGVMLIRAYMDDVRFNAAGTCVTFCKRCTRSRQTG